MEAFMSHQPRRLLGDIIAEKKAEHQSSCKYTNRKRRKN